MKANEYVKQNGWTMARKAVAECTYGYGIDLDELKLLVESHDVVNQYPSLDAAKERLQYFINWLAEDESHAEYAPEIGKFKQAIADVESCYD